MLIYEPLEEPRRLCAVANKNTTLQSELAAACTKQNKSQLVDNAQTISFCCKVSTSGYKRLSATQVQSLAGRCWWWEQWLREFKGWEKKKGVQQLQQHHTHKCQLLGENCIYTRVPSLAADLGVCMKQTGEQKKKKKIQTRRLLATPFLSIKSRWRKSADHQTEHSALWTPCHGLEGVEQWGWILLTAS